MRKIIWCIALCASVQMLCAQQVTLQDCLQIGLENNYSVRIVRNNQQISDNNATLANAGALPTVGLTGAYTGRVDNTYTTPRDGDRTTETGTFNESGNIGLNAAWDLFDGFRIQTNYQKLQEFKSLGAIQTRITVEDFIAGLTSEYYNFIQQKIRLENYHYAVKLSRERLRIAEARHLAGNFSKLDVLQASVDFNADSSAYMKQTEQVLASLIRMNEMMARPQVTEQLPIRDSAILINKGLQWAEMEEGTMEANSELLASEHNQAIAKLDLKAVQSRNYPYVRMNAGYGYNWNGYGSGTTKQRQQLGPSGGVSVGFTIFDGNRRREQTNAKIQIDNAALRKQELELTLMADLANFWQAYQNNIQIIRIEEENLVAAKENLEIAQERYLLGNLSGIEMREAQKSLLNAEERILNARYNTKLCEISLQLISGNVLGYLE